MNNENLIRWQIGLSLTIRGPFRSMFAIHSNILWIE